MKHHKEHMERINQMKPVVDNKKPRELPMSGKKEIERRRFREKVEKGNRLLLDRLGKALERKNIDNERKPIKFNSLEQGKKKLELARVTMENQLLLERIQLAQPMYDHHQWERDAEHREFYLKNMTEFPELYVPHYPPLRNKFIKEQQVKEDEKSRLKADKLARRRAREAGIPYSPDTSPSKSTSPTSKSPAKTKGGQVSPPKNEPPQGFARPEPLEFDLSTPHVVPTKPHSHTGTLQQTSWKNVQASDHPLQRAHVRSDEKLHETEYVDDKGEKLLHGHHEQAVYSGSHHVKANTDIHHTGYDEETYMARYVSNANALAAPYQMADTHGAGHSGIVGGLLDSNNANNIGILNQAAKHAGMK